MKKLLAILTLILAMSLLLGAVAACNPQCSGSHLWDEGVVTKEATCTQTGERLFTCTRCGRQNVTVLEKLPHTWDNGVVTPSTCTEEGYVLYTCTVCSATSRETLPCCNHTLVWREEVAPTCTQTGVAAHYQCSECGGTFDINQNAVTLQSLQLQQAHVFGEKQIVKEPTCVDEGQEKQVCTLCGKEEVFAVPATGQHTAVVDPAVAATCTESGLTEGSHCSVCGTVIVAQQPTPLASHSWGSWQTQVAPTCTQQGTQVRSCTQCGTTQTGTVAPTGHHHVASITPATCTEGGYTTFTCACGDSYTQDHTSPLGHRYSEVVTPATCTEGGCTTHTCDRCGHSYTDSETQPNGHSYAETVIPATCTEGGCTTHTCSVCGDTYTDAHTEPNGHTEGNWIVDKAATCTQQGLRHTQCTSCGITISTEIIPTIGHTYGPSQTFQPTCTQDGYSFHVCTVCGRVENFDIVPASHKWVTDAAVEPTCTESGLTEGSHCSVCGTVNVAQQVVPAAGHEYQSVVTPPTCTEGGYTTHICSVCDHSYTDNETQPNGHIWDGGHVTIQPTCTSDGEILYTCTVCSQTKVEISPACEHNLVAVEQVPSTCSRQGVAAHSQCQICHGLFNDKQQLVTIADLALPLLPHTEQAIAAVAPTCTESGLTEGVVCAVCGTVLEQQQVIPATGHSWGAWQITSATCTEAGSMKRTCQTCGEEETQTIQPTGHVHKLVSGVAPTCTAEGITDGVVCAVCNTVIWAQQVIPATGHDWQEDYTYNETSHWKVCHNGCDEVAQQENHTHDLYCTTCGWVSQSANFKLTIGDAYSYHDTLANLLAALPQDGSAASVQLVQDAQGEGATLPDGILLDLGGHTYTATGTFVVQESATIQNGTIASQATTLLLQQSGNLVLQNVTLQGGTILALQGGTATIKEGVTLSGSVALQLSYAGSEINVKWQQPPQSEGTVVYGCEQGHYDDTWVKQVLVIVETDIGSVAYSFAQANQITPDNLTVTYADMAAFWNDKETDSHIHIHSWNDGQVTTQPTCTETGIRTYTCTECHATKTAVEPALGHNYNAVVTDPTCTEQGYTTHTCDRCDDTYVDTYVNALGHSYTAVVKAPTCTDGGFTIHTCDRCGDTYTDDHTEPNGHTEVVDAAVEPSCTQTGLTQGSHCSVCDTVLVAQQTVPAKGHTYTNNNYGHNDTEHWRICDVCNAEDTHSAHQWGNCQTNGADTHTHTCSVCGATSTAAHSWNNGEITTAPTCAATGVRTYTCTACGQTKTEEIPATGNHNYTSVVTAPTCTIGGYTTYTCTVCGHSYTDSPTDPTGHTYTNNQYGSNDTEHWLICDVCGTADTGSQHSFGNWTKVDETSCQRTCSVCGYTQTQNHNFDAGTTTKKPTCTEEGSKTFTCQDCGQTKTEVIAANGHTVVTDAAVEATCTESGLTQGSHCSVCNTVLVAQTETPATGHSWSDWTVDDTTNQHTRTCSACSATESGAHNWSNGVCTVCSCNVLDHKATLVTNIADLSAGDSIVLVGLKTSGSQHYVSGAYQSPRLNAIEVSISNNTFVLPEDAVVLTLGKEGDKWTLTLGETLIGVSGTDLKLDSGTTTWTISIDADGNATITSDTGTNNNLQFNASSPRFKTYTTNQVLPQIYKVQTICRNHVAGTETAFDVTSHWNLCATCGGKVESTVVAHAFTSHEEVSATCTAAGTAAHKTCTCGAIVANVNDAETLVTSADLVIAMKEHNVGEWIEGSASCTEVGQIGHYVCQDCKQYLASDKKTVLSSIEGSAPLGHDYVENVCSRCNVEISEADILTQLFALESGQSLSGTYKLTGTVTEVVTAWSSTFNNITVNITIGEKVVQCYRLTSGDADASKLAVGYTITVVGTLKNYNGTTFQFNSGCTLKASIAPAVTLTVNSVVNGTISTLQDSYTAGTEVKFTVTPDNGYKVASVKANDTVLTAAEDGSYSFVINQNTTITVEIVDQSVAVQTTVTLNIAEIAAANSYENGTAYESLPCGSHPISVQALGTVNNGKYYTSGNSWRFYTDGTGGIQISATEGYELVSVKVTYSQGAFTGLTSGVAYTVSDTEKSSVSFYVSATTRVTEIEVVYQEATAAEQPTQVWQLATSIAAGDQIVIVQQDQNVVAGTLDSGTLQAVAVTFQNNTIASLPEGALVLTVGVSEGAWTLSDVNGNQLGANGSLALGVATTWAVTFDGNNATISANGGTLKYNPSNSNFAFNPASSLEVQIYKLTTESSEQPDQPVEPEILTISATISDLATAKSWTSGSKVENPVVIETIVSLAYTGGGNTGKYYSSDGTLRIYQNESPTFTISIAEGYVITSVVVTYSVSNSGIMLNGETQVSSGTIVEVNGLSITFGVGNTGTKSNGQVKITAITVNYYKAS